MASQGTGSSDRQLFQLPHFQRKVITSHSSLFFDRRITRVNLDKKPLEAFEEEAHEFDVIHQSLQVVTSDNVPMLYFIKRGMLETRDLHVEEFIARRSLRAILELIEVYDPTTKDPRNKEPAVEEKARWASMSLKWGIYVRGVLYSSSIGLTFESILPTSTRKVARTSRHRCRVRYTQIQRLRSFKSPSTSRRPREST